MLPLYRNIKNRRLRLQLTQSELAKLAGYSDKSMIAKIEKGGIDLPLSKVEIFADALNTTPSELMGDTWESDVLDNARADLVDHFEGDAFEIAKFNETQSSDALNEPPHTIAAHFDGDEYSEEQLDRIKAFAAFIKSEEKK